MEKSDPEDDYIPTNSTKKTSASKRRLRKNTRAIKSSRPDSGDVQMEESKDVAHLKLKTAISAKDEQVSEDIKVESQSIGFGDVEHASGSSDDDEKEEVYDGELSEQEDSTKRTDNISSCEELSDFDDPHNHFDEVKEEERYRQKMIKKKKANNVHTIDNLPTQLNLMLKMLMESRSENTGLWKSFFRECLEADIELEK